MAETESQEAEEQSAPEVELPAPVIWPLVMALGVTLLAASLVTQVAVAVAGLALAILGAAGWVRELLPEQGHVIEEATAPKPQPIQPRPGTIESIRPDMHGYRMQLPEHFHPYSAGVKGGLAGAVAMAIVAAGYGIVSGNGIWYPINLLAGMVVDIPTLPDGKLDIARMKEFHFGWLVLATLIHGVASMSVGLMYGVVLPTLPQRRFIWGGLLAPLLWTGALYAFLGVLNPVLRSYVDWWSFVLAQFAFGIVVDLVVMRSEQIPLGPLVPRPGSGEGAS
jgi:hypothetical protein